ncbi:pyridoxamine 5'-phosphate oxidase family protein [Blastococcus sp. SYSU D00695]
MSTTPDPVLVPLTPGECHRLLGTAPIGRLAFTVGALPTIEPVHFAVRDDEVLIPTRRGSKVQAASRGAVVAFEVDDVDVATRTGWSVTVVGPSRVLSDAGEVAALHAAGLAPWVPAGQACVVAVRISRITGRRLSRRLDVPGGPDRATPGAVPAPRLAAGG